MASPILIALILANSHPSRQVPAVVTSNRKSPELIGRCNWQGVDVPINGTGEALLSGYDKAMTDYLKEVGAPGGALAVFYKGGKVYSKGFGYAHLDEKLEFTPATPTRISSLSKYLTKKAVKILIAAGYLSEDLRAIEILQKEGIVPIPPKGKKVDPRIGQITIKQLLDHKSGIIAGLDISQCTSNQVIRSLGLHGPVTDREALGYILGQTLQSDPGTKETYSNFGFALLGKIVQIVSGETYEGFVKTNVLKPLVDPAPWFVTSTQSKDRRPEEAEYYSTNPNRTWDAYRFDICAGAGGWVAPMESLARFFSREFPGTGWDYTLFGSYTGAVTVMKVHKNTLTFAASVNYRRGNDAADNDTLFRKLETVTDNLKLP